MNEILLGPGSGSRPAPASTGPHHHTAAGAAVMSPLSPPLALVRRGPCVPWSRCLGHCMVSPCCCALGRACLNTEQTEQLQHSRGSGPGRAARHQRHTATTLTLLPLTTACMNTTYQPPATSRQRTRRTYMLMEINGYINLM